MIRTTLDGGLRIVELDRPDCRNALTREGLDTLREVFRDASEPVVYLTGAGSAFCAGADLDVVSTLDRESAWEFARQGQQVARTIADYDGAVVAGIDGPARGGGVELALACDLRIGTPDATFAESGVSLGLFGAWGGTSRLTDVVGQGHAMDLSLSGRVLDAQQALDIGLITRITDTPRSVAMALLENDTHALRVIKHRIRDRSPREQQEKRERDAFSDLIPDLRR